MLPLRAGLAVDGASRDLDGVISLEQNTDCSDSSAEDVTGAPYPAEVIVEGQQMNKVGHVRHHTAFTLSQKYFRHFRL